MVQSVNSFSTSASLIRQVQRRDPEAWSRFSRLYAPLAYRWTRHCGLQPHDAADVVQNVFVSVSQNVDRYTARGSGGSFRGWLWTITRNAIRQFHRQQSTRPRAFGGSEAQARFQQIAEKLEQTEDDPDAWSGFDSGVGLAHRALNLIRADFEPQTWTAFWRTTIEDQTAAEVGDALGMTAKAVRQAKYRVLCRLREILASE